MANYNNFLIVAVCCIGLLADSEGSTVLSSYNDCKSCTSYNSIMNFFGILNLRWCPLDRTCHISGSEKTPCLANMNIQQRSECLEENTTTYNVSDAYTSVHLAAATYTGNAQKCLDTIYPETMFQVKHRFGVRCNGPFSEYDDCSGYTAVSDEQKVIVAAFRGSNTNDQVKEQILSAFMVSMEDFETGGMVQKYYGDAYKKLYPCVKESLVELRTTYSDYKVRVTGHSLGGALASLIAVGLIYNNVVNSSDLELYAFGTPRVGDKNFAYNFDRLVKSSWLIVHNRDSAPHFPPCLSCYSPENAPYNAPFHHKYEVFYPDLQMNISSQFTICQGNEDYGCSNHLMVEQPCLNFTECMEIHRNYFGVSVPFICYATIGLIPDPWTNPIGESCVKISS